MARNYVVKATLHFDDGVLPGSATVNAEDESDAERVFKKEMLEVWRQAGLKERDIEIIAVRKR